MTTHDRTFADRSDGELLSTVHRLAADERQATARLIASLAELDARRLYLAEGRSSLYTYCTQVLRLSEHAAYLRIEAARAARKYPMLLERLEAGEVTLTTIGLLAPHLTPDNHQHLIEAGRHKSKREVEHLVATLRPQPPVASVVRKLPQPAPSREATPVASSSLPLTSSALPLATSVGPSPEPTISARHSRPSPSSPGQSSLSEGLGGGVIHTRADRDGAAR